jgi:parvulin-like peptidyl-prolyl isomerase
METMYCSSRIDPHEVVTFLLLTDPSEKLLRAMIRNREAAKEARRMGIQPSDRQLQQFADEFRRERGLWTAETTLAFLRGAELTLRDFEAFCESAVLASAFREHLADEKGIQQHFADHRSEFDRARISVILVKAEGLANEIKIRVRENGEDFRALARRYSQDAATRSFGGKIGEVHRHRLPPFLAAKVFGASRGDVIGPIRSREGFLLILVEKRTRAELDDGTREAVKERILREWETPLVREGIRIGATCEQSNGPMLEEAGRRPS